MKIIIGYAAAFAWVFMMIFALGGRIAKKTNIETSRKIIHTSLFMMWVIINACFKGSVHQIILPAVFTVLNALSYKFKLYSSVERQEDNHPGTIYFAIAVTAVMTIAYFVPSTYMYTGAACFALTFGDGFAALVGYNVKSPKIRGNKSIAGFGACFAAGTLAMIAFKLIYLNTLTLADCVLLGAVCAIAELTGSGCDNFTVTFCTFGAGLLLQNDSARFAFMWAVLIFCLVFFTKAITYYGALLAAAMIIVFRICGGTEGFVFFAGCYMIAFIAGIVKAKALGRKRHEGRGLKQIAVNGGLGTLLMLLYGLTGQTWLEISALASIGGNFIDSISSDVGCISKQKPYDPFRRERVETGLSGGMSYLGTGAALACSVLLGVYTGFAFKTGAGAAIVLTVLVFAQTLLDTYLGSRFQRKNRCAVCGEVTEKDEHCGKPAEYLRGVKWLGNSGVNLISSIIMTLVAVGLFALVG